MGGYVDHPRVGPRHQQPDAHLTQEERGHQRRGGRGRGPHQTGHVADHHGLARLQGQGQSRRSVLQIQPCPGAGPVDDDGRPPAGQEEGRPGAPGALAQGAGYQPGQLIDTGPERQGLQEARAGPSVARPMGAAPGGIVAHSPGYRRILGRAVALPSVPLGALWRHPVPSSRPGPIALVPPPPLPRPVTPAAGSASDAPWAC